MGIDPVRVATALDSPSCRSELLYAPGKGGPRAGGSEATRAANCDSTSEDG